MITNTPKNRDLRFKFHCVIIALKRVYLWYNDDIWSNSDLQERLDDNQEKYGDGWLAYYI